MVGESDFLVTLYYEASGKFLSGKSCKVRIGKAVLWVDERREIALLCGTLIAFLRIIRKEIVTRPGKCFNL